MELRLRLLLLLLLPPPPSIQQRLIKFTLLRPLGPRPLLRQRRLRRIIQHLPMTPGSNRI
jgi:hypothetical protein